MEDIQKDNDENHENVQGGDNSSRSDETNEATSKAVDDSSTTSGVTGDVDKELNVQSDLEKDKLEINDDKTKEIDEKKKEKSDDHVATETKESQPTEENKSEELTITDPASDLNLPPKQTLGKGKRARIPNKRYSDILLSPSPRSKSSGGNQPIIENGNDKHIDSDSGGATPRSSTSSPAAKRTKLQQSNIDITNPIYRKPFEFGWKREIVYKEKSSDVFYYTPANKKLRNIKDVADNLTENLTIDNFTFHKEPTGIDDPDKEIVRGTPGYNKRLSKQQATSPKISSPRGGILSNKTTKIASPKLSETQTASPKTKTKNLGNIKVKLPNKKGEKKKPEDDTMDIDNGPPPAKRQSGRKSTKSNLELEHKPCQPCSIRCQGVSGLVPTLHCQLCLCLYHYECVGLSPLIQVEGYICKNCQIENGATNIPRITTPNQQRIPRPNESPPLIDDDDMKHSDNIDDNNSLDDTNKNHTTLTNNITNHNNTNGSCNLINNINNNINNEKKKNDLGNKSSSLVGSVTTWLPHSSTIQLDNMIRNKENEPIVVPRPQYIEYLGGRKFLIIPKHNVVSISPPSNITSSKQWLIERQNHDDDNIGTTDTASVANLAAPAAASADDDDYNKLEQIDGGGEQDITKDVDPETQPETPKQSPQQNRKSGKKYTQITKTNNNISNTGGGGGGGGGGISSNNEKLIDSRFMDNYFQHVSYGYNTLLYVFQYLKVQDLLRAACVCTMWRDIASHPSLWKTLRMKNSQVHSFEGLSRSLQKHGTVHLDLRKMLLPPDDSMWPEFSKSIENVKTLRKIELCRCPSTVVEQLPLTNPELEVINAVTIKCDLINLEHFFKLDHLKELRLKSFNGLTITSDLTPLKELKNLTHLSLTSIKDLHKLDLEIIAEFTNLESLDLGECTDLPEIFGQKVLIKLTKLEKLRLEKGQGNCHTFEVLDAVRQLPHLEQLELVNFDIKNGFDLSLGLCGNIKKLLIIPTYISQSATTNHMVLGGVLRLQSTLSHFVWGVTLELLRVTELFIDQCEDIEKKDKDKKVKKNANTGHGDSIPVLKPVPTIIDKKDKILPPHDPPEVEIVPLPNLQKLLLQSLPTTRVKILKIPFHATWRQSITDTVN